MTQLNEVSLPTYRGRYYPRSRADLVQRVAKQVSPKRFEHILRVEEMALRLAKQWSVDLEQASVAALTHDYAKEQSTQKFLDFIDAKQLDPNLKAWNSAIWHGIVGAEIVADELDIQNQPILDAIRQHTTGAPYMTTLSQILYMADYVEMGRDFPGVDEARALAFEDLRASVGWQTKHTLAFLVANGKPVYPLTILTYNEWSVEK